MIVARSAGATPARAPAVHPAPVVFRRETAVKNEPATPKLELWRQLVSGATSFRPAALLFASAELNLYENISAEGSTAAEVAERLAMPELGVRLLMNALGAIGLLAHDGACFHVHPELRALLTEGPDCLLPEVLQYKAENELWLQLADLLRAGDSRQSGAEPGEAARLSEYLTAVQLSNRASAEALVTRLREPLEGTVRVLDIGGGRGDYAQLVLGASPGATVTVFDRPAVIEQCRQALATEVEGARLRLVAGDALDIRLSDRFDLVLISDLLHYFGDEQKARILEGARRVLAPGGLLALSKFALGDSGITPPGSALFSMKVHLKKAGAHLGTDARITELMVKSGFENVTVEKLDATKSLILARAPAGS
jgi:demethylspheroidene O-methyltransferase